jgi:hypothetical protein
METTYNICMVVVAVFSEVYLRQPNVVHTARLLSINVARGLSGMLRSIDCMQWAWKTVHLGGKLQYHGHTEGCTVVLEAVASQDLWIWYPRRLPPK